MLKKTKAKNEQMEEDEESAKMEKENYKYKLMDWWLFMKCYCWSKVGKKEKWRDNAYYYNWNYVFKREDFLWWDEILITISVQNIDV